MLRRELDREVEGSGIGLSLVERIVKSDGPGNDSTFCFTLAGKDEAEGIAGDQSVLDRNIGYVASFLETRYAPSNVAECRNEQVILIEG